jgi:flagellar biosynthesis/type III secretory pathway protein FliH
MEQDAKRESAYKNGYNDGYNEGRWEGIEDAQFYTEDDLFRLSCKIEDEHGINPEEAINLLTNYANGEPVSEKDLMNAIWALSQFYWGTYDIINDMEDYYSN